MKCFHPPQPLFQSKLSEKVLMCFDLEQDNVTVEHYPAYQSEENLFKIPGLKSLDQLINCYSGYNCLDLYYIVGDELRHVSFADEENKFPNISYSSEEIDVIPDRSDTSLVYFSSDVDRRADFIVKHNKLLVKGYRVENYGLDLFPSENVSQWTEVFSHKTAPIKFIKSSVSTTLIALKDDTFHVFGRVVVHSKGGEKINNLNQVFGSGTIKVVDIGIETLYVLTTLGDVYFFLQNRYVECHN